MTNLLTAPAPSIFDQFPALAVAPVVGIKKPGSTGATIEPGQEVSASNHSVTNTINFPDTQSISPRARLLDIEAELEELALHLEDVARHPVPSLAPGTLAEATQAVYEALRAVALLIHRQEG